MLFRNGDNLKEGLKDYLTNKKNLSIFSPYIKSKTLQYLLDTPNLNCDQIVVRWEPNDFAFGSSDLEVFDICMEENIALYMNNRIHLKLFTENFKDAFLGSANISERAISSSDYQFNYETCTHVEAIDRHDRIYLINIINESTLITQELFDRIKLQVPKTVDTSVQSFDLPYTMIDSSDFLISKLPMTESPNLLWELFSRNKIASSLQEENCLCHDISLYKMNINDLNERDWMEQLANNFFASPFITSFLQEIDSSVNDNNGRRREGLRFGAVRSWFSKNTTSAPSPRPFELTENVQILYRWIEELSKGKYIVTVPGARSQVIKKSKPID